MARIQLETDPSANQLSRNDGYKRKVVRKVRGHGLRNCSILMTVFLLVIFSLFAYWIAKTGLLTVPVLSAVVYETPRPNHLVVAGNSLEESLQSQISQVFLERLTVTGLTDRHVTFSFPETSLTTSFKTYLLQNRSAAVDPDGAQIAVIDGKEVEVFVPLKYNNHVSALTIGLLPTAKDGFLKLDLTRIAIGQLELPHWMFKYTLEKPLREAANQFNQQVGRYATLNKVELIGEDILLDGDLTIEVRGAILE